MGLADRNYMRSPSAQRGRASRLNAAPTDGIIWEEKADNSPAANHMPWRRRMVALALWLTAGTAVFTFLWAIACAMIGAQWHGQGTTFTPKTTRGNLHTGGSDHATR